MKHTHVLRLYLLTTAIIFSATVASANSDTTVFQETNGLVAVEAEHFDKQTKTEKRQFYLSTAKTTPKISPDGDP